MFNIQYKDHDSLMYDPFTLEATNKLVHYTIVFNAAVVMSLFQEINSRKTSDSNDMNVFEDLNKNFRFTSILGSIFVI